MKKIAYSFRSVSPFIVRLLHLHYGYAAGNRAAGDGTTGGPPPCRLLRCLQPRRRFPRRLLLRLSRRIPSAMNYRSSWRPALASRFTCQSMPESGGPGDPGMVVNPAYTENHA